MKNITIAAFAATACLAILPASAAQAKSATAFKVPRLGYQLPKSYKINFGKVPGSRGSGSINIYMPASVRAPRVHIVEPVQTLPRDFTITFKEVRQ